MVLVLLHVVEMSRDNWNSFASLAMWEMCCTLKTSISAAAYWNASLLLQNKWDLDNLAEMFTVIQMKCFMNHMKGRTPLCYRRKVIWDIWHEYSPTLENKSYFGNVAELLNTCGKRCSTLYAWQIYSGGIVVDIYIVEKFASCILSVQKNVTFAMSLQQSRDHHVTIIV